MSERQAAMKLSIRIIQTESGDFAATCPSLPGCRSRGQTAREARDRLDEAIRGYIASISDFVPEKFEEEVVEV